MNPLNYPADNIPAMIVLAIMAWAILAIAICIMMQQPNDDQ